MEGRAEASLKGFTLMKVMKDNYLESFTETFEKVAEVAGGDKMTWAIHLGKLLIGAAHWVLPREEAQHYNKESYLQEA